jgi:hypothetical protein
MKRRLLFTVVLISVLLVGHVRAEDLRFANLNVSNTPEDLLLNLHLEGAFSDRVQQAVLNGEATTFKFVVVLNRVHKLWIDETKADFVVIHTIRYDSATQEFGVTRSWRGSTPERTRSFQEARQWMTVIERLRIISLSALEPGNQYQLKTKAIVRQRTLPLKLHRALPFVSMWDFATDWYTIDFIF